MFSLRRVNKSDLEDVNVGWHHNINAVLPKFMDRQHKTT
jgi:hypothetical protein